MPRHKLFVDITPGDYVVHVEHGIARFSDVINLSAAGSAREYLVLQYAVGDRLYVPTDQIDRVSRYVGAGDRPPTLSRLGTQEWVRSKQRAREAAEELNIPHSTLTIKDPRDEDTPLAPGIMLKGRAAITVAPDLPKKPWAEYTECGPENFEKQGRVHVDPYGFVHVCQGIVIGNIFEKSLKDIFEEWDPREHPITGPLLEGGPAKLAETYGLEHRDEYADECEFCFDMRLKLRERFPLLLCPDQMYGTHD